MTDNIVEKNIPTEHRGHAAGTNVLEKKASQLASDVKYKVRKQLGPDTKLNPAQVARAFLAQLAKSPAPPAIKTLARKKLMGESYIFDIKDRVKDSLVETLTTVFVDGIEEEPTPNEYELYLEATGDKKYWIMVTDKKTRNTYRRRATRAKISELRSNPNISRVELTGYHPNEKEDEQGVSTAKVKSGKGLDPVGQEDDDVNNDGKVNKTDKYLMNRRNVRTAAINRNKFTEEFIGEVKDSNSKSNKQIKGKANNSSRIKVFPTVQEQVAPSDNQSVDKNKISTLQRFQKREEQLNREKLAAQRSGKLPVGSVQMNSYEIEGEDIQEVSPPGFKGTVKAMKKHKEIDNPWALANWMKQKGYKSHRKASGAMKESNDSECESEGKYPKVDYNDSREIPTKLNLVKNKMRAMGLKMSYEPDGKLIGEEESDRMRDYRQMRGGADANVDYRRPPRNTPGNLVTPEERERNRKKAMEIVRQSVIKQYGKDALL